MLFRILCFFNPHEIVEVGNGHETTGIIYLRAVPRAKAYLFQTSRTEASLSGKDPLIIMVNQVTEEEYDEVKEFIDRMLQSRETVVCMQHMHSMAAPHHHINPRHGVLRLLHRHFRVAQRAAFADL